MPTGTETLLKKTQRGLSILAFETTKQSRILKKRMRVAALQKEIKADLRDLGNLVYNAVVNSQQGILGEEEVKILVQNIGHNKAEVERLRDSIGRLGKARKHFPPEEGMAEYEGMPAQPDEAPVVVVEPSCEAAEPPDVSPTTEQELEEAVFAPPAPEIAGRRKGKKGGLPPAPGADLEGE